MNGKPVSDPALIQAIYDAVVRRDSLYDGLYYTGVHSTGIFCRPSCRSRIPLLKNVSFYASIEDAIEAGFRPCKRCKPEAPGPAGPEVRLVQAALVLIGSRLPQAASLAELAASLHISPYYLQRVFKRHTGVSPNEHVSLRRLEQAQELLSSTSLSITEIALSTGFSSASYFASFFQKRTGTSPTEYRLLHEKTPVCGGNKFL
ncbi:MAG: AraC family transcriptional regulator [Paenibacillaceae bacterium]|jgi:AraC family transcriptional regulator of adaptative response / methylphosphotriester-DNA alkyltransferase methyltransferase|nr:AraC family transcriptional regulator [Paenibacillaceae bacterium]